MHNLALELNSVRVVYPRNAKASVYDISFGVKEGTITTLIGPNGSGKSTVIKAILGLVEYGGEIKVFGKEVARSYSKIGFVPQRVRFDDEFPVTVSEFVQMPMMLSGLDHKNTISRMREVLVEVGLAGFEKKMLSELSGGMMQRVLLARAIAPKPRLLIFDEPEAGVDVAGEQSLYELLKRMVDREKVTVLVASHELDVVYTYADTVVCINHSLVCTGKPKEVLNREMFEKLYGRELRFYGHKH